MDKYLEAGVIVNTHGIGGAVMIKSLCDSIEIFCSLKTLWFKDKQSGEFVSRKVLKSAPHKGMVLATIEGIDSPEAAMGYKNKSVYALRDDFNLEDGSYFIADLIGLPVINLDTKKEYGTVADVINNGGSDIYEIKTENGFAYMPAVDEFVKEIDLEKGIFVIPIEGMFDEI